MEREQFQIYRDMKERTNGEIYIGVVGPVRSGKSTLIKRMMETLVLPEMQDSPEKLRLIDEMPQSAAGKTIMTTEPKFIPKEAALIRLPDDSEVKLRMVDCVGYMVEGASGHIEDKKERKVKTPWFDSEIPFTQAAEVGTKKVIREHSTIGFVVTTDGSFGELERAAYEKPEEQTITELKTIGKPFIVLLNTSHPFAGETRKLALEMEGNYGIKVLPVNCEQLRKEDVLNMMEEVLESFPISKLEFQIPKWTEMLPVTHPIKQSMIRLVKQAFGKIHSMKDCNMEELFDLTEEPYIEEIKLVKKDRKSGTLCMEAKTYEKIYYQTLSELAGIQIENEYRLIDFLKEFSEKKSLYDKIGDAYNEVKGKGYGVVVPDLSEITLEEPEMIRHGNKYGVKLRANSPSIHMIKAGIDTEIAPIVGTKEQAEDLITYMKENANAKQDGIWQTSIFGKTVKQLVEEGIQGKVNRLTDESQMKLQETIQKVVNESNGGLVCIII